MAVYRESTGFQFFGRDWTRHANDIGTEALQQS